jgi:hypothetical protein
MIWLFERVRPMPGLGVRFGASFESAAEVIIETGVVRRNLLFPQLELLFFVAFEWRIEAHDVPGGRALFLLWRRRGSARTVAPNVLIA